ncbi:RNA polymerase sigma-70 factor (ECF subfamily) [Peribacillus deserti]|uniref:RNA polymerase sigma-70 factor (ECF subfamily) n=1 Tax=Peribacillus deserti TaxID=673318 RepID=A0ABS2QDH0_9BACI|nr:sigma factor-like helix-turn-helix DNA-binding protein [Peribacillus deserti]MBM7691207.1 RNA polymerase sigma-70 factor (ECF subfamily) [Peribacillus deserti]
MNSKKVEKHEETESVINIDMEQVLPGLVKYCCFLSQNKWDGEDIAQEAVLKAMQSYAHKTELTSSLLKKIAYNQWIDLTRKRNKETVMENAIAEERYESPQILEMTDLLIKRLTPKQAVILLLKEGFQYKSHEIADLMNSNEVSIKSALHRAKKRLAADEGETKEWKPEHLWEEKEEEKLTALIHQSLQKQDPSILIRHISDLHSLKTFTHTPTMVMKSAFSPEFALSMAA